MEVESYFSSSSNLREIILKYLNQAEHSIFVAVAWFTDEKLFEKLLEKQKEGVEVQLLITKHEFNKQSKNTYELITQNGGFFVELGDDFKLMHNKFCIIDHNHVLNGSFNWTRKANESNSENLSVISGDPKLANQFIHEFEKLKELAGFIKESSDQIALHEAFKIITLIRTLIEIGDPQKSFAYSSKIQDVKELKHIYDLIQLREYEKVLQEIRTFQKGYTQVLNISYIEKEYIRSQIKIIISQIQSLEIEKTDIEGKLDYFNHRYILELNPLLIKILALKKKINQKLKKHGVHDEEFQQAEKRYKEAMEELEEEEKINIPELGFEQEKDIKELYRSCVKFCHPDSLQCIYEDKVEAAQIFGELSNAYKRNDLEKVKYISEILFHGASVNELESYDELNALRARLETLKSKLGLLAYEISQLKLSEVYDTIINMGDMNQYFEGKKEELQNQFNSLKSKFVNHEA